MREWRSRDRPGWNNRDMREWHSQDTREWHSRDRPGWHNRDMRVTRRHDWPRVSRRANCPSWLEEDLQCSKPCRQLADAEPSRASINQTAAKVSEVAKGRLIAWTSPVKNSSPSGSRALPGRLCRKTKPSALAANHDLKRGRKRESVVILQRPEIARVLNAFSIYPRLPELNQESGRHYRHEIQK